MNYERCARAITENLLAVAIATTGNFQSLDALYESEGREVAEVYEIVLTLLQALKSSSVIALAISEVELQISSNS